MMKVLSALVLISVLAVLAIPMVTSAAEAKAPEGCEMRRDVGLSDCPGEGQTCSFGNDDYNCGVCCLLNTIYGVTDVIFVILIGLAAIFVIVGAMMLMTAAGAPERVASGRNYIMYAAIGLAVAFLAKAVPTIVRFVVAPTMS
jgi:hypothetical protein